jgi:hypothetical protein
MYYYVTVDGEPYCSSGCFLELRMTENGLYDITRASEKGVFFRCSHDNRKDADTLAAYLREHMPERVFEVVEGDCPTYEQERRSEDE